MSELIDKELRQKKSKFGPNRFVTDIIFNVIFGLAIISFFFKFMHWPGGGLGMALVAGLSLLLVLGQLIEGIVRKNLSRTFLVISGSLLLVFFAFRLQYWPGATPMFIFAALVFATGMIIHLIRKQQFSIKHWIIVSLAGLGLLVVKTENSSLYYNLNLSETFHSGVRDDAYMAWRRYAWILHSEGKKEEANKAMDKCLGIMERFDMQESVQYQDFQREKMLMENLDDLFYNFRQNTR
jgi:hypothetical protein